MRRNRQIMVSIKSFLSTRLCLFGVLFIVITAPALAVVRDLHIVAPVATVTGRDLVVTFVASTDAGQGEHVGFLHAEYSNDGGKTWVALCYLDNIGTAIKRGCTVKVGSAGTTLQVRVRAAFRGGLAGDVDYTGAAVRWKDTWENWGQPPTRVATVIVK